MTLTLDRITKRVGSELHLDAISLELAPGTMTVLLGPTLAGKTTLMRLMAGLERPSDGRVLIDGRDVTGIEARKRSVAMVYQQFINYPSMTVYNNIASPLKVAGQLGKAEIDRKVREAAEMMRIGHLLQRLPAELSGGQQQRTAIARSLVRDADLLLLDEPLVNLDYKLREELRAELVDIFSGGRTTVVYATTEPLEALMLGGNIAVLDQGRLLQSGQTLSVYHRPASLRVGEVFSDPPMNMLPAEILPGGTGRLSDGTTFTLPQRLRFLQPGPYRLGIRANHVSASRRSAADIAVPSIVDLAEISGSETFVHARHGAVTVVIQLKGVASHQIGEGVTVHIDPGRLYAFDSHGTLVAAPERVAQQQEGAA